MHLLFFFENHERAISLKATTLLPKIFYYSFIYFCNIFFLAYFRDLLFFFFASVTLTRLFSDIPMRRVVV